MPKVQDEKIRFGLRAKLFVLLLSGFVILISATLWQIGQQANRSSLHVIERSLEQTNTVLTSHINSRFHSMTERARSISGDSRILPLVYEKASQTLQDQCSEIKKIMGFDVLIFTDARGEVLARSDRPEMRGFSVAGVTPYFDAALAGKIGTGYLRGENQILQIVSVPVFDNVLTDRVRGTVSLAFKLDRAFADEVHALTSSDIGFLAFQRLDSGEIARVESIYNTSPELATRLTQVFSSMPELWKRVGMQNTGTDILSLNIADEAFLAVTKPLSNEAGKALGFIIALRSQAELKAPFIEVQRSVLLIGLVCCALAGIFAWLFARNISQPVSALVALTQAIENGDYRDEKDDLSRSDEIGLLHRAVHRMGTSLREKAELEDYLAQMSSEFDDASGKIKEAESLLLQENALPLNLPPAHDDPTIIAPPRTGEASQATEHTTPLIIDHRYRVLRLLGKGAMGMVYLAYDNKLEEHVAVKLVSKEVFKQQGSINIKEEIRLARRITHRNILRTFDFGDWENYYYITMEYVPGYDLSELLKKKGALAPHIAILLTRQICTAMAAAHAQNIVHLDLKPGNMMINRQGILKIMDFGLARTFANENIEKINQTMSASVEFLSGTPRFMAPEQFTSKALDGRTDIYAIGIIMVNLFTGSPPFSAPSFMEIAFKHMQDTLPELIGTQGPLPEALVHIIEKATAKDPSQRYQSVNTLLKDIHNLKLH